MKIIPQPNMYQCEICGTAYKLKENAILCNSLPIEDEVYFIGDKVTVESRYDGPVEVIIEEELDIMPDVGMTYLDDNNCLIKKAKEHKRVYRVSKFVEICKDGTTDNIFTTKYLTGVRNEN
ncbi:MAG: hypothetical protein WC679_12800 [Bacteroidales bacterium]|jgi:hypothetical protein